MSQPLHPLGRPDFDSQDQPSTINNGVDQQFDDPVDHMSAVDEVDQLRTDEDDNPEHAKINAQDSNPSVIEETQFVPLEVDTQGKTQALDEAPVSAGAEAAINDQDSNASVVADTQFIELEADTQAETQVYHVSVAPLPHPTTKQAASTDNAQARGGDARDAEVNFDVFINADAYADFPPKAAESSASRVFIERPTISLDQDDLEGFKYRRPPAKHRGNLPQAKLPQHAFGGGAAMEATGSTLSYKPDSEFLDILSKRFKFELKRRNRPTCTRKA